MKEELPRLVVLDDSQEFLEFLKKGLGSCFRFACLHYKPGPTQRQVLAQIRREKPDHLLLDLNLGRSECSHELLEQLTTEEVIPTSCKIWIISQGGHDNEEEILKGFQRINANTQNRLLRKPITPNEVCAELIDETVYSEEDFLGDTFPLPFRVLSRKGRVAYANRLWTKRNYPNPIESTTWQDHGEVPDTRDYVGSFFSSGKAGFTLYSFRLEQGDEPFLGQVVEQHPLNPFHSDLPKTLEHIFKTMRDAGFTRGRYYNIRSLTTHQESDVYDKVAELSLISYEIPSGLTLPYRFRITGEIRRRLEAYGEMNKERLAQKLHYCIRTAQEDQEAKDLTINELNRLLKVDNLDSWLEVPVWIRDEFTHNVGEPTHQMIGLLIFDRAGHDVQAGIDREVTHENVKPLNPLLRSLLCFLSLALKRKRDHELKRYVLSMQSFDAELLEINDTQKRYQKVLETLCRVSGAKSGMMGVIHDNDPDILEIVAPVAPPCSGFKKLRLSLKPNHHPIAHAFDTKSQFVCQDLQNSPPIGELIEEVQYEVKSLIAIPVMTDSDRPIGGVTLQFDLPWVITRREEIRINDVLQRSRWVMQQALHKREQIYWHQTLSHDLKSDLDTMDQYLHIMENLKPELTASPQWRQIKRYLQDSVDLAENWLDMLRERGVQNDLPFSPYSAIEDYVNLNQQRIEDDKLRLNCLPSQNDTIWVHPILGNRAIFARVIRTLLDNAFKFGRVFLPEDQEVEITLAGLIDKGMWILEILNPGQMSSNEYLLRFEAGTIPKERKADGAHVGLSVAQRWTNHFGGTLTVENDNGNRVKTCLSWPISQSKPEESENGLDG